MIRKVFLDTSYVIALSSLGDRFHESALHLANELESSQVELVTSYAILLEIGNALSKRRFRPAALALLRALRADPKVRIANFSIELFDEALKLFSLRADKDWGLIDCMSFVIMSKEGITQALTTDDHFRQAGFEPLMKRVSP